MNSLDEKYFELVRHIIYDGYTKESRTGVDTISTFGNVIRHNMKEGFPILTTKEVYFKGIVTELIWFLKGKTNIKYLVDKGVNIWVGDAWENYKKKVRLYGSYPNIKSDFIKKIKTDDDFARKWGDMGNIYGKQWRDFSGIDQIQRIINTLKNNPDSRRMLVSAWNVIDLDNMVLPPCHYAFQVYTRDLTATERENYYAKINNFTDDQRMEMNPNASDKDIHRIMDEKEIPKKGISLMSNIRSSDVPLGLPFNISSYGLLLEILGKIVNMVPDELIVVLGDTHIYKNQIEGISKQLNNKGYSLPNLVFSNQLLFNGDIDDFLNSYVSGDIQLENYENDGKIKIPLSN